MNKQLIFNAEECFQLAERRAADYFEALYNQVMEKIYISALTKDIHEWKQTHIHRNPILSFISRGRKSKTKDYYHYIRWLEYTGKLEPYLERSISYLYMRDLGLDLSSPDTQEKIKRRVDNLKNELTRPSKEEKESFSMAKLYRWGQKEGIEQTIIWLLDKLKMVSSNIPEGMDPLHAQRKLIKIIAGVLMHVMEEIDESISQDERSMQLDKAVRLGYSYGLTYPFVDDLLDANVLSEKEKKQYSNLIRTTLVTGTVPELGSWAEENLQLLKYVHSELRDAFEYIKGNQHDENLKTFFEQSFVFFHSQEVDREKDLFNPDYSNEDLYIPIILKSSSSRLIVRSVLSAPKDEGFDNRTFYYGIYNQLADDFADMFDDMKEGAVTPYTYYLKYHEKRPDLINPYELYWAVISFLIHHVYRSDRKTCEVILDRAINGLKRFKERMGTAKYNEVMGLFNFRSHSFNRIIQNLVQKADDVDFFDKLLRDHIISMLKNEQSDRDEFLDTIRSYRNEINSFLPISDNDIVNLMNEPIIEAANYSLKGDGKRIRPIMTWVMGDKAFGLNKSSIVPLLKSLEYMHTASLIFDDLPSQDNASVRRGRPTLHKTFNAATAELTGLFLTQKAIEEQASLDQFDANTVVRLIRYSAQVTEAMCRGQAMDLHSKGKQLSLEQLNTMCLYKTGLGFEASLVMPAILAQADEKELEGFKKFALHAGIAFQIKDDLLDVEGLEEQLGKPSGKDAENHSATFVTILGIEGAKKEMWDHFCQAIEVLQDIPRDTTFLKHLLNYIVNRNH